jgi:hypothetical protein
MLGTADFRDALQDLGYSHQGSRGNLATPAVLVLTPTGTPSTGTTIPVLFSLYLVIADRILINSTYVLYFLLNTNHDLCRCSLKAHI